MVRSSSPVPPPKTIHGATCKCYGSGANVPARTKATMTIISARALSKAYGPQTLFTDVALTVSAGDRVGLLGVNGTGKSTLLRILAGVEPADTGTIDRRRDAPILYLSQEPEMEADQTPRAIVESGLAEWYAAKRRHEEVSHALEGGGGSVTSLTAALEEQERLSEAVERLGGWDRGYIVDTMLDKLGVRGLDRPVGTLSGGERRRVALAKILVASPALAILDEPTNHLDTDTIEWLEDYLANDYPGAVLIVTHDRYVLDAVATRIFELDRSKLAEFTGNYSDYLEQKQDMLEQEGRVEANRMNFLRREREWLSRGPKARSTKQKARIQRAHAAIAIEAPRENARVTLEASAARMGKTIVELHEVGVSLGERELFSDFTLHMVQGERIGIVGPNGVGKTTLLKLVSGELAATRGKVVRGLQTKIAYFDQARAELEDDWSIFDNVAERKGAEQSGGGMVQIGERTITLRTYLEGFLFEPSKQRQKVGSLSGGERARVSLAKTLKGGNNLLMLDEPTNDLDVATLGALEDMLTSWPGCALIVSHDRYFLNRVATSILAFENGVIVQYQGNYDTYRALRPEPVAPPSIKPHANANATIPGVVPALPAVDRKPLSFAEKLELEKILDRIAAAEELADKLERDLAEPSLYASRGADVVRLRAELAAAKSTAAELTVRWESLEARR